MKLWQRQLQLNNNQFDNWITEKTWADQKENLNQGIPSTTRCNNRDFNLTRRETREILLHIIKQAQEKYPFKLYALCIMLNHVHYLMEAENPCVIASVTE